LQSRELVYDYERGEIIDVATGEVVGQIFDSMPSARASDYAEWESKIHHAPMRLFSDRREREIYFLVQDVGRKIEAPEWLREDVFRFLRRVREKRSSIQAFLTTRRAGAVKLHDWKFVLATYYVIARRRGLSDLAEHIAEMKCEGDTPCYRSKKLKDKHFYRYMVALEDVYRILNQETDNHGKEIEEIIRRICAKLGLSNSVLEKSFEKLEKLMKELDGSHPRNIAVASVLVGVHVIRGPEEVKRTKERMIKELKIPESSIREIMRRVPDGVFEVVYCIFYIPVAR